MKYTGCAYSGQTVFNSRLLHLGKHIGICINAPYPAAISEILQNRRMSIRPMNDRNSNGFPNSRIWQRHRQDDWW